MEILEAIKERHSVRQFVDKPVEQFVVDRINEEIKLCNSEGNLDFQLVVNEPKAFAGGFMSYGKFSGVNNYIALIAPKEAKEKVGYYGERLVLLAQSLGLNSCWVGLTYKKVPGVYNIAKGEKLHCVIALGYGKTQGVQHSVKDISAYVENYSDNLPGWFVDGVRAAMLCPTAVNQQKFRFSLVGDRLVRAVSLFSMVGYTQIDLGIAKYHFEQAADRKNFDWAE